MPYKEHIENGGIVDYSNPTINGNLNETIVKVRKILNTKSKDMLFKALDEIGKFIPCLQCPEQLINLALFLKKNKVKSYLEIGCYFGGTFIFLNEVIQGLESIATDSNHFNSLGILKEYENINKNVKVYAYHTLTTLFDNLIKDKTFDVVFIDGDHSYAMIKSDYEKVKDKAKYIIFHNLLNKECPDVIRFWKELKANNKVIEFCQDYADSNLIWSNKELHEETLDKKMGIGVIVND